MLIPFALLTLRLWHLQIWQAETYAQKAFRNVIDRTTITPERGQIFDSKGRVIARNMPSYNVALKPIFFLPSGLDEAVFEERVRLLKRHLAMTEKDTEKLIERIKKTQGLRRHHNLIVKRNITRDQMAIIETNRLTLPGVEVLAVSRRHYPFDDLGVHLIGYIGEINDQEFPEHKHYGYHLGDMIGRSGLERSFESVLRGSPGLHANVVDSRRVPQTDSESRALLGDWKDVPSTPGKNLVLTIDMDVQRILRNSLRNYDSGAAVALDPRNGRILGMESKPTFNPNSWSGRVSRDEVLEATNSLYKPLLNKALLSFFPGSTYKIVTAFAALEMGLITAEDTLHCPGYLKYGRNNKRFRCHKRAGHKEVNLIASLEGSCDVYYYKLGDKIGMDKLASHAKQFGFGSPTGIGVSPDSSGLVPTIAWHKEHDPDHRFYDGLTLSTAIGQGDTRVSPLQLALAFAAIANGGTVYHPLLLDRIETADGRVLFKYPVRAKQQLDVKPENLHQIVQGLDAVVNSETGTAYNYARLDYVRVAGKTGTAQVLSRRITNNEVDWLQRDHAWFAAFAPVNDPEIVVIVFLEHGGSGGKNAGPIAREILDRYFREIRHYNPLLVLPEGPQPKFLEPRRPPHSSDPSTQMGGYQGGGSRPR